MNLLDIVLVLLIVTAAVGGYRIGFIARGASWLGLGVGILLATVTVPWAIETFDGSAPTSRLVIGLVALTVTVTVVSSLGQLVGMSLSRNLPSPLRAADRGVGAAAGGLSILLLLWFLLPAAAEVPGAVARQVRNSVVVGFVRDAAPRPPDTIQALRRLVDTSRFPEVFADLQPAPVTGPPPSEIPVPQEVVADVTASTANVETEGCGNRYEGSAFVVGDGLVVTNAHVVAGADTIALRAPDGQVVDAEVVAFDDDRDLALLSAPDIAREPLPIGDATEGQAGAVIGYPGGQDQPRVAPAGVGDRRTAVGRDIHGEDATEREILILSAELAQGDSGSPLIDADGAVIGVVFAISPDEPTTAFALSTTELGDFLDERPDTGSGRCV